LPRLFQIVYTDRQYTCPKKETFSCQSFNPPNQGSDKNYDPIPFENEKPLNYL